VYWEEYGFIDVTDLPDNVEIDGNNMMYYFSLPYDNLVLIQKVPSERFENLIVVSQVRSKDYLKVSIMPAIDFYGTVQPFEEEIGYTVLGDRIALQVDQEDQNAVDFLHTIMHLIHCLNTHLDKVKAVRPKLIPNFANRHHLTRAKKGKTAFLTFTYSTLELKLSTPEPKNTTSISKPHGPPREHDRRGHWRSLSDGRKVWVRSHKVGDPTKGVIRKTYKVVT
jgi:hypothetical protein